MPITVLDEKEKETLKDSTFKGKIKDKIKSVEVFLQNHRRRPFPELL